MNTRRELTLERQIRPEGAPIEAPVTAPKADEANSWITFAPPDGPIQFRHPQNLQFFHDGRNPDALVLKDPSPELQAAVGFEFGTKDSIQPDAYRKARIDSYQQDGFDVSPGPAGWLPEADWPRLRVYRFEALAQRQVPERSPDPLDRVYLFGYVLLGGSDKAIAVEATTSADQPGPFRKEVEGILKTVTFGTAAK